MRKAQQILQLKKKKEEHMKKIEQKVQQPVVQQQEQEVVKPQKKNIFAAFSSQSQQEKIYEPQSNQTVQEQTKTQIKKPKKKKNKKKTEAQEQQQMDKLLNQIKAQNAENGDQNEDHDEANIFKIYENRFNYQKELKQYFKTAEQQQVAENNEGMNKREKKMQKAMNNHMKMKKSVLIPGNMNYFPIAEKFEFVEKEGMIWIEAGKKYEVLQEQYEAIKNSNDINEMFDFLQRNPFHTDALYNIGQFFRLKGNYKEADTLIQRIIYIYETSSLYNIGQFIKENRPQKQIAYGRFSSSLFMALFKFIDILGKKGCYKAGLQYCKFLLKLNISDPSACLLCFDYNALSAKQYQYFIDFTVNFPTYLGEQHKKELLYWVPNYTYSFALAKFLVDTDIPSKSIIQESNVDTFLSFIDKDVQSAMDITNISNFSKDSAQVLMLRAILLYPKILVSFAEKNQYSKQHLSHSTFSGYQKGSFKSIIEHKFFELSPENYFYTFLNIDSESDSKGLLKVLECYTTRSKILWKNNKVMLWVKAAAGFLLNYIDSHPQFNYNTFQELLSIKSKHTQNIPNVCLQFKKYQNVSKSNFTDQVERIDLNNIQDNQGFQVPAQQNLNPVNLDQNPFRLFFNTLLPWVNLPQGQNQQQQDPDMPIIQEDHPN